MKKPITIILVFFLLTASLTVGSITIKSSCKSTDGNTLYVGGSGPNNYTKIQDAIDDASHGDTVFVFDHSSPYYENIVIDKSIDLVGEDRDSTIIDGSGSGNVVSVVMDGVNIVGFTIRNSGFVWGLIDAGISISSSYCNISFNTIINCNFGIELENSSSGNTIMGNNINGNKNCGIYSCGSVGNTIIENDISNQWNGDGITLGFYSNDNIITGNNILNNCYTGIWLDYHSSDNSISGNNITYNSWGIDVGWYANNNNISANDILNNYFFGIQVGYFSNGTIITGNNIIDNSEYGIQIVQINPLDFRDGVNVTGNHIITRNYLEGSLWPLEIRFSYGNIITENTIFNNDEFGINIYGSADNTIAGNYIIDNLNGISIHYSTNNSIIENIISNNENKGILIANSSSSNMIYHNTLLDNTRNGYDECGNIWDNDYPSGGNYWDDYYGTDDDGDGVGDTPYNISGGENQDMYPLMEPWNEGNNPPNPPTIDGPTQGKVGEEYDYTFTATDPDGDDIYYLIFWGDEEPGNLSQAYGPYPSGTPVTIGHTWKEKGIYLVQALTMDIYLESSDITTLEVTMPRNKPYLDMFQMRFPMLYELLSRFM